MENGKVKIWVLQQHFRVVANILAKDIFEKLNSGFDSDVFLIGILETDSDPRFPYVVLEGGGGISDEDFNDIDEHANVLAKLDKEFKISISDERIQEAHKIRITHKAYRQAITNILAKRADAEGVKYFVSFPTKVNQYQVFVILKLNKKTYNSYYTLTKTEFQDHYQISTSFINSLIDEFLKSCKEGLYEPNPGINSIKKSPEEIFRLAGRDFMYTVSQVGMSFNGLHGLYDACNTISSLRYEGIEGVGRMLIAAKNHQDIDMDLELIHPIQITDFRKVRKFLEIADDKSLIICDSDRIYGLGHYSDTYNINKESIFEINFLQHYQWEVSHFGVVLMTVSYAQPTIPKEKIDKSKFQSDVKRIFNGIKPKEITTLWDLISESIKQKHGTMLVISENAKKESIRLEQQCFSISPVKLEKHYFKTITSIDGAVLLDQTGVCYAIGVILDGLATSGADSSRGARYNSAIRYFERQKTPTLIIIISEDGMIDLIPRLMPQVKRSLIDDKIGEFQILGKSEKPNQKAYNNLVNFFNIYRFYLTANDCKIINSQKAKIETKLNAVSGIIIKSATFIPDNQLNDSYYISD